MGGKNSHAGRANRAKGVVRAIVQFDVNPAFRAAGDDVVPANLTARRYGVQSRDADRIAGANDCRNVVILVHAIGEQGQIVLAPEQSLL
jgi:hypothetical protein